MSAPILSGLVGRRLAVVRPGDDRSDTPSTSAPEGLVVVHQAIGMMMEYLDCSGLSAFEALITQAEASGQAVSDLSGDVVERRFRVRAAPGQ